jgi:hypothetical protein
MADETKVITVLGTTYNHLEREIEEALRGVAPDRIIAISYTVSRVLGLWLQHHALIVLRRG